MGVGDKISAGADKLKGKTQEAAGNLTDDDELKLKGKGNQVKGEGKKGVEQVKDAVKDASDEVKE